ncbi:hypothetical protein [Antarctobacter heliothermus]|uniref:Uncharacterized protein n=1 Tax=Antarctobacter heliothermus TaxID=74033 RepID=A0A239F8B1_9RHOB|nr:hypothetical protein [Antarctobacter heliothermus]SNS53280.1 hypothetical protein SAMN04488078_10195 [Antarctobacter heliothermus]
MNLSARLALSLATGLTLVGPALAESSGMYGTWVSLDQQCVYDGGYPSSAAFTISLTKLEYFETSCQTTTPPQVGQGGATATYVVRCDNGMDKTTYFSLGADDLLTVSDNGYTYLAKRCS